MPKFLKHGVINTTYKQEYDGQIIHKRTNSLKAFLSVFTHTVWAQRTIFRSSEDLCLLSTHVAMIRALRRALMTKLDQYQKRRMYSTQL
jgi:hypothetical protein